MNVLDLARDYVYTTVGLVELTRLGIDMRRKQREQARKNGQTRQAPQAAQENSAAPA